ncbi:hypothetical protein MSUIS_04350 [Mycoplasma suis KI3806]|uniref:Uncharacterized protein n=1 Tax=Mycoplasma suis (strain KI_3806) TaxID=708248 RepID=F0V1J7_MYCS3|nr:hypothetical protein [Mycoplasma suis]CBZ40528.1 hypothetical protein MSUIS_04350 [Mycoplasma suis KI3806]
MIRITKDKDRFSNHIRGRSHFFSLKLAEKSMYQSLSFYYRKYCSKNEAFNKHKEKILTASLFLLTTSSFLYKKKEESLCTFHWRNYLKIFSRKEVVHFLFCAILYLIEYDYFGKEDKKLIKESIKKHWKDSLPSFEEAYLLLIIKKNTNQNDLCLLGISSEKYSKLVSLALQLSEIIRYEISEDYSKVLNLIEISDDWKERMAEIFGFKSEYISFLYFVNLRRKNKKGLQNSFIKFCCWISFLFSR